MNAIKGKVLSVRQTEGAARCLARKVIFGERSPRTAKVLSELAAARHDAQKVRLVRELIRGV